MTKHSPILDRLTLKIAEFLEGDRSDALRAALKDLEANPKDAGKQAVLIDETLAMEAISDPVHALLAEAWSEAIATASRNGAIKPIDANGGSTIFGEIWDLLFLDGWDGLPSFHRNQLLESISKTAFKTTLRERLNDEASDLAAALLADILAGRVVRSIGATDIFTNGADRSRLRIAMEDWAPVLADRDASGADAMPMLSPDGMVFHRQIDFPSGRVLVADAVNVGPLRDAISNMRSSFGLSLNYGWHRTASSALCAHLFGVVNVAMGSDGPSLVRAAASDTVFAGFSRNDAFKPIADICHDLWATTMIDRARLIEMMLEDGRTCQEAEAEIDAWLAQSRFHTEIEMPAGIWLLYWDDDCETLAAELRAAGVEAPDDTRFVLCREPLPLNESKLRDMSMEGLDDPG
jgi:hypothetical protein